MKKFSFLLISWFLFTLNSCMEIDCKGLEASKRSESCIIVVEDPPAESSWFKVTGYHPDTKKPCECKSVNRWWSQFSKEIKKGDTIIKRKGELTFTIHKKDTVITHYWICKGKVYK